MYEDADMSSFLVWSVCYEKERSVAAVTSIKIQAPKAVAYDATI